MGRNLIYPKTTHNTIHRESERATYDTRTIHEIVNTTPVVHVSFPPDPSDEFPAILPMIGQMGSFADPSADLGEPLDCYLHGYVSSRLMNLARASEKGLPVCISATKVDGFVLSLTPFSHSYNYRSAVLQGYGTLVTEKEEKMWAMELITNSAIPDQWKYTRVPPDGGELASTSVLRVKIVSGSGKMRNGGPHDDKKDLNRSELTSKIWTGVIPIWQTFGTPVEAPTCGVSKVPERITNFLKETNEDNEEYGKKAAKD
ncbi:MAG: hypothetical protein M1834_008955 [Cirrosporium novae-zelandiae]|nr:MAG: hypothetical protein M1834_008955 [Cirrosporium novae-zelandiae]